MRYAVIFALLCQSAYAADPLLVAKIVQCESGSRTDVCHRDKDDAKYGPSCGIAQFKEATFYEFAKMAHLKNPRWMDFRQQTFLLDWALDHGYASRWSCYEIVKGEQHERE